MKVWVIVEVIAEVVGKGKSGSACRVGVKQVGAEVDLEERCFLDTKPKLIPLGVLHEKEVDVERGLFVIKNFKVLLSSNHIFMASPECIFANSVNVLEIREHSTSILLKV